MTDGVIPVQNPASFDNNLDTTVLTVSGNTVNRERMTIAGSVDVALADVLNDSPATTAYGMTVREAPTARYVTVLASSSRTTTQTQSDQTNHLYRGVTVVLDVTTPGTGSITLEIDGLDTASGKYIALLTGAAVTTTTTNRYTVYPTITAVANQIAQDVLWETWRVKVVANNANAMTYSVGAILLP